MPPDANLNAGYGLHRDIVLLKRRKVHGAKFGWFAMAKLLAGSSY
jgi:hypothetical protein